MTKLEQPSASPSDDREAELVALVEAAVAEFRFGTRHTREIVQDIASQAYALGAKAERASEDRPGEKPAISLGDVVTEAGEAIAERASELYFDAVTIRRDAYAAVVAPFIYRVYDAGIGVGRAHEAYLAELSVAADRVERDERAGGGEMVSKRESVLRERKAFVNGVCVRGIAKYYTKDEATAMAAEEYPLPRVRRPLRVTLSDGSVWSYEPRDIDPQHVFLAHSGRHVRVGHRYDLATLSACIDDRNDFAALARILSGETEEVEDRADSSSVARGDL